MIDASVKAFEEAHAEFLTAERLFHARQCGLQELDAKFHILKRLAARAVAVDAKYQATIAGVINRMRVIQRKVSEGVDPHVEAERTTTTRTTVRPRSAGASIVAAFHEAERCIEIARELYNRDRFSEMVPELNRAMEIANRLSRVDLQLFTFTEGDRRTIARQIGIIRAEANQLRQMRDQTLLLRKAAATGKTKKPRQKIRLGPLGWFFIMVVCVASGNVILGAIDYIWDNFPYLFFLPLVYVWVRLGLTKR